MIRRSVAVLLGLVVFIALIAFTAWSPGAGGSPTATPPGPLWHIERKTYRCAGARDYVLCHSAPRLNNEAPYRVMIDGRHLWVSFGGTLIYECWVRSGPQRCRTIP